MPFLTDDVAVTIKPSGVYVLTAPLVYAGRDDTFTVPAGYVTDLASVPRLMTWLVPVQGAGDRAAIVHDWLCTEWEQKYKRLLHALIYGEPVPPWVTSRDIDGILRRILRELGVPLVRRWLMWAGVRWAALTTPARRPGWWRDAPLLFAISAVALPFLLLPALFVGLTLAVDGVVERVR